MGTTISTSAMRKQLWSKEVLLGAMEEMFLSQFMKGGKDSPIVLKADFSKDKGYFITLKFSPTLSGEGVDGDDNMEGQEESISSYTQNITIDQKRNAVVLTGNMDEQKEATNMRSDGRDLLSIWLKEAFEKDLFRKAGGLTDYTFANTPTAPSSTRIIYGGNATSDSDIDSGDKMTLALLFKISNTVPTYTPLIKPISYKGKKYYILLIHPRQRYDLMQDNDYLTLQKDAGIRGLDNPLFSGADAIVDNLVIHVHNYVPTFSDWGSGSATPGARAILMGAQAMGFCVGKSSGWAEKEFDYGNVYGICCGRVFGTQKLKFNSEDYGIVSIDTYATSL